MRKSLLLLLLLLTFNCSLFSQNDEVIRIIVIDKIENNTKANHAPAKPQIECFYYPVTHSLELSFLSNLGLAYISLENQVTGEICDYSGNTSTGIMMIPVEANTAYRMEITTENGRDYYAVFFTCDENYD